MKRCRVFANCNAGAPFYNTQKLALAFAVCLATWDTTMASDVDSYLVQKGVELTQLSSATPTANINNGYVFESVIQADNTNSVSSATVTPPGNTAKVMTPDGSNTEFKYKKKYDTLAKLNNGAPSGNYALSVTTLHDGAKNLTVALPADSYPATAHLLNFDAAQNIDAGGFFILRWEYQGDGAPPDFVQLRIEDANGKKVFETADKGQDSLDSRFTSLLLSRGTLQANESYQGTLLTRRQGFADQTTYAGADGSGYFYRRVAFTIKTSPFASNADVKMFSLQKTVFFTQTIADPPVVISNNGYIFHAQVDASGSNLVKTTILSFPNGKGTNVTVADAKRLEFESKLDNQQQLDGTFPDGNYGFVLSTQNDATKTFAVTLTGGNYPPAPKFKNLGAAQSIDPAKDFTIEWEPFAGASSLDFIHLQIEDETGTKVMETGDFAKSDALNAFRISQKIQDGTLLPGKVYTAKVLFLKVASIDATSYPGALGVSGYARETHAQIQTAGAAPGPTRLALNGSLSQGIKITVNGTPGVTYRVEGSSNLQHWVTFATITLNTTHGEWIDTTASLSPYRFYRSAQ